MVAKAGKHVVLSYQDTDGNWVVLVDTRTRLHKFKTWFKRKTNAIQSYFQRRKR